MPTVLRVKGYRFFFFSNDSSEPRHIHVESGDRYAKFWLEPISLAKSAGYSSKELTHVHKVIEEYKDLLRERWDEYFGG